MNEEQMFNGFAHTAVASQMAQTMALLFSFCTAQGSRQAKTQSSSRIAGNPMQALYVTFRVFDSISRDCKLIPTLRDSGGSSDACQEWYFKKTCRIDNLHGSNEALLQS